MLFFYNVTPYTGICVGRCVKSVHVCGTLWYLVLSVTWLIDVQSKHCSFACMSLEGRVNEALAARSACFFIIEGDISHMHISLIKRWILKERGERKSCLIIRKLFNISNF